MVLGALLVLPLSRAGATSATANTTIDAVLAAVISISSSGTVTLNVTPTGGGVQTIGSDSVSVSTNDTAGYTLQIADSDVANTNLVSGGNNIPASAGTQASPVTPMVVNTWGYCVSGIGGFGANCPSGNASNQAISGTNKYAGVPVSGSPNTIKTTATTASNDATTVWYAVAADTTQPSGTYSTTVTYTATAN